MTTPRLKAQLQAQAADDRSQGEVFRCPQPMCPNLSMRSAGTGLGMFLCERHQERLQRHGHAEVPSIPGPMLRPYVETSRRWIKAEQALGNVRVQHSLFAIKALMTTAGRAPSAFDIAQWTSEAKAEACWARLREAGVTSERIMGGHLGIVALLQDDTWAPRSTDYAHTQSAKAIWRLASGTHLRYDVAIPVPAATLADGEDAPLSKVLIRKYPRPRGQALRIIGRELDEACGSLAETYAAVIIALKEQRHGRHECHTVIGYEPAWRKADRDRHEAALKLRQQAQAEQQRQSDIKAILGGAFGPSLSWQPPQRR